MAAQASSFEVLGILPIPAEATVKFEFENSGFGDLQTLIWVLTPKSQGFETLSLRLDLSLLRQDLCIGIL